MTELAPSAVYVQRNILLVDDNPKNLRLLSEVLNSAGYKVRPANSGQLALDAVQTILPDLILLDIMMPNLDGYQVCRELKANDVTRDIPVIFISAVEEMEDRLKAFELGGVDYILKPFQPEDVLARVRLHLQLRDSQLLLQHEIKENEIVREELQYHKQGLEDQVTHRTRELSALNIKLQNEINLHKSTEKALFESEKRYHALVNVGFHGILIHRNQKIVSVNQPLSEMLQSSVADLKGKSVFELLPPDQHSLIRSSIQEDRQQIIDHDIIRSDGRRIPVESVGFESVYQGRPARFVAFRDVSEKQNLREAAERSSRLASLGELAAGVAHEINNPNAVIHLNAPIIKNVLKDIWPLLREASAHDNDLRFAGLTCTETIEMLPQMLTRMEESSDRIKQIVMDLKDFVRDQDTRLYNVIDLNQIINTSCRLMENTIRKATISFDFQPEPSPVLLQGDFQRIEQVIINLIQNACQALTDMQQKIVMRTYHDEKGRSCLEISDQGCGISEEDLPKITNPFFTTKRNDGGTGLGLSVSARILLEHAATMDVNSVLGQGTCFSICFPVIEEMDDL